MSNYLVTFLASFLIWFMFAGLVMLWWRHGKVNRRQVFNAIIATFVAWAVSQTIKTLFPTVRPYEISGVLPLTLTIPKDPAFPSGHTSVAFALAMSVQKHSKKAGYLYILFALLVGLGRVLGNVHYYIDIVGGAVVGIFSVFFLENFQARRAS